MRTYSTDLTDCCVPSTSRVRFRVSLTDPDESSSRAYHHVSFSLQLRKQTGARIDVDTEDIGDERVLLISGFPVQVCKAKAAIHQILTENTPVSEQLSVPQRSVGRIIGTTGQLRLLFPYLFTFAFLLHLPKGFSRPTSPSPC